MEILARKDMSGLLVGFTVEQMEAFSSQYPVSELQL